MQSHATEGTLAQNAVNAGYVVEDVEEREVDAAGYAAALAEDPAEIARLAAIQMEETRLATIAQTVATNLPSLTQIDAAITALTIPADAKTFLKKLCAVVYQHVMGKVA